MTNAIDVAAYLHARPNRTYFDNRSLQKLVYFSQAWSMGWTGRELFDDDFEAWADGPVERELWKCQRYTSIPAYSNQLTPDQIEIVESVLAYYGTKSSAELVDLSHEDVWQEARDGLDARASSRNRLSRQSLRRHYAGLAIAGSGPKRNSSATVADHSDVVETSRTISERWKDGLELLATK